MNPYRIATAFLLIAWTGLLPAPAHAHAEDDPILVKLMLDELERRGSGDDRDDTWDAAAWIGKDLGKVWIKSKGARGSGRTEHGELQLLYSKAVATYWDLQVGAKHDFEPSPSRTWAALGLQGLAPYFFEIDAAIFVGDSGHTALRFEAEYELLLTQRIILTPEIEANFYGKADTDTGRGSGLSEIEAGLRLRYEIRREFAPYVGVTWFREFGGTADWSAGVGRRTSDTQFTLGLRAWF